MTKKKNNQIKIKKKNEGSFTKEAKKRGMSVKKLETQVLNNTNAYPSSLVKKANFSRNARKWSHKKTKK